MGVSGTKEPIEILSILSPYVCMALTLKVGVAVSPQECEEHQGTECDQPEVSHTGIPLPVGVWASGWCLTLTGQR